MMEEIPRAFIGEADFVDIIGQMQKQKAYDIEFNLKLEGLFPNSEINLYDNSLITDVAVRLLRRFFPVSEEGHCEITHYCYCLDFGKYGENVDDYETAEDLYKRLSGT